MFSPGTVPLRNTMRQKQISFFSDTRSTIAILLILALQITSIIVFYHNQTIMRNEFKDMLTKIYENQCEKHSGISTERSETDNPARSPGSKDATLNAATTPATLSTQTTTATLSTTTTAATLSTATTVGVSTTNTNFLVENETIRRYSDLVIPYRNWSSQVNYFYCVHRLKLPVTKLYIVETETHVCFDYESCKVRMNREWGWFKNTEGYADIQYHFLIGGDGSIFEGLSWICSQHYYAVPDRSSIVVAMTGYTYDSIKYSNVNYEVNTEQYAALKLFIMANVINGNLSPSFQLIPHCCVSNSGNPGKWVYTNLTLFEHFYDCHYSY